MNIDNMITAKDKAQAWFASLTPGQVFKGISHAVAEAGYTPETLEYNTFCVVAYQLLDDRGGVRIDKENRIA